MSFIFGSEESVFHLAFGEHRRSILNHSQLINPLLFQNILTNLPIPSTASSCSPGILICTTTVTLSQKQARLTLLIEPWHKTLVVAPLEGLFCKLKYRANTFSYFYFISASISQSCCRKHQFMFLTPVGNYVLDISNIQLKIGLTPLVFAQRMDSWSTATTPPACAIKYRHHYFLIWHYVLVRRFIHSFTHSFDFL